MAKLLISRIHFQSEDFDFDFSFREGITVVTGDSATGKSLFYERFSLKVLVEKLDKYRFLNYQILLHANAHEIKQILSKPDKVYIIDNADLVLKGIEDINCFLAQSESQFVIFGRRVDWYNTTPQNCANVVENNKRFKLQYLFEEW